MVEFVTWLPLLFTLALRSVEAATLLTAPMPVHILAGDWEAPRLLWVGYDPSWEPALATLLQTVAPTPVLLLVRPQQREGALAWLAHLGNLEHVRLADTSVDSPWVRDYAPLQQRAADGGWRWVLPRYHLSREQDQRFGVQLAQRQAMPVQPQTWVLEGGGIVSNGAGLCAMTQASYNGLHSARPSVAVLTGLGCAALVIGPEANGEPTGHVDMLLQFASAETVMLAEVPDAEVWQRGLEAAARHLDRPLRVVRVPTVLHVNGTPYTPVNGLRTATHFLVPTYEAVPLAVQRAALHALALAMPHTHISPIPADALWAGGGAWHCATWGLLGGGGL